MRIFTALKDDGIIDMYSWDLNGTLVNESVGCFVGNKFYNWESVVNMFELILRASIIEFVDIN